VQVISVNFLKKFKTMIMLPFNSKTGIIIFFTFLFTNFITTNTYCENTLPASFYESFDIELNTIQAEETNDEEEPETIIQSPARAAMLSATLPGLGQIYNRKYWKVPIIYAGFGVLVYYIDLNNTLYQDYRTAYYYRIDGNPHTEDDKPRYSTDMLNRAMNHYRRNLEITYLLTAALYILNILDANVDAHLMDFDISEDLSMRIEPAIERFSHTTQPKPGLKLTFNF